MRKVLLTLLAVSLLASMAFAAMNDEAFICRLCR